MIDTTSPEPWDAMTARLQREQDAKSPKPQDAAAIEAERDALRTKNAALEEENARLREALSTQLRKSDCVTSGEHNRYERCCDSWTTEKDDWCDWCVAYKALGEGR